MRPAGSERALRRLVADLAGLAPADVEDVLTLLEPGQRRQVAALLSAFAGLDVAPVLEPPAPTFVSGLSPWLTSRLASNDEDDGLSTVAMTPAARAALRAGATRASPDAHPSTPPPAAVGLSSRFVDLVTRRGRP